MRVCVVPRWGGSPDDDWYPWLKRELGGHEVRFARLSPSPSAPSIEACVTELRAVAGTDADALADTVLVGHSVGCQAALRFLEALPTGARVHATVCVAAWWWVDEPWDTIRPWIERPMDRERVRAAAGTVVALLSDDDPFTSDQTGNGAAWARHLGAEVTLLRGKKHLNRAREPAVLETLRGVLS